VEYVTFIRFETAADDYRKLLNQECVGSTPHNSPTHLVTDENTSSSPVKQVGKTEAEQHILGFMADQVGGSVQMLFYFLAVFPPYRRFLFLACWTFASQDFGFLSRLI
jgi:hypothetical protein